MEYLTYCFVFAGMLLMGTLCTLLYLPDFKMYRIVKRTYGSGNIQFDVEHMILVTICVVRLWGILYFGLLWWINSWSIL